MNVTPEELLAEAGQMALELRLKDRAIAALEARLAELQQPEHPPEAPSGPSPAAPDPHLQEGSEWTSSHGLTLP